VTGDEDRPINVVAVSTITFLVFNILLVTVIIRLEARLRPNIRFTFERAVTVFTRSDITPPKVNRFGLNLEHSEYIV